MKRSTPVPVSSSPQADGRLERASLHRRIAEALATHTESSPLACVLLLDLDRFKTINFSLGHAVGDQLLDAVARRIRATVRGPRPSGRPASTTAPLGGDRFALLLEGLHDASDAVRVAKRIHEAFRVPFVLSGREVHASACIGIATATAADRRPEDLLRDADAAVVRAKATGPGSIAIFDTALARQTASRLSLEAELLRAVAAHELSVHYQPIVNLADGRLVGFEALARWTSGGIAIPPSEFVPVAEDIGIIVDIDRFVLREVCRQIRAWDVQFRTTLPLWVAINLSGKHFLRADTLSEIDRAVRSFGIWGRRLKVEITESAIMEHAAFAEELLRNLKTLDIAISIDDFGTGYSSLAYLQRFAIDTLKIDCSFVQRMDVDHENW
ncbi:MAG: bifunctional diguanylate cyclase/phosphodiesterase, partial [Acidobacteria bacterium]|nr:bifunctional diguanylate cyclase/phosphodiesterase [Acidobacteriota bacterium]